MPAAAIQIMWRDSDMEPDALSKLFWTSASQTFLDIQEANLEINPSNLTALPGGLCIAFEANNTAKAADIIRQRIDDHIKENARTIGFAPPDWTEAMLTPPNQQQLRKINTFTQVSFDCSTIEAQYLIHSSAQQAALL